jgi:hypothetical protein
MKIGTHSACSMFHKYRTYFIKKTAGGPQPPAALPELFRPQALTGYLTCTR